MSIGLATASHLHDHRWVAKLAVGAAGAVLLPSAEGIDALCQFGRDAFVASLNDALLEQETTVPTAWRLLDAWPASTDGAWVDALLAQPRPEQAELLDEQRTGDATVLTLRIPLDLQPFDVHFPTLPILPGVVQLAWALAFGASRFNTPGRSDRVEMLKFQRPLRPGERVTLSLRHDAEGARLHFAYASNGIECSSGRMAWGRADG